MYLDVDKLKHVQAFGDTFSGCFKGGWYVLFVEDKLQAAVFAHAEFNLHEGGYWDVVFDYPAFDLAYYSEPAYMPILLNTLLSGACAIITKRLSYYFESHSEFHQRILLPNQDYVLGEARDLIQDVLKQQNFGHDSFCPYERMRSCD